MAARERTKLTDAAVARLRPRDREYTVWDRRVPGLGVRVRPSGGRSWILLQEAAGRSKRISLGPVPTKTVDEARRECHARRASPEPKETAATVRTVPTFREFVAGPWKKAHLHRYKPSSRRVTQYHLDRQLLPAFGPTPLDRIGRAQVRRWFDRYSRTAPGGANRALDILRQIMNFAAVCGYVESNPAKGLERNRRPALTRFLSREEVGRLHEALDRQTCGNDRQQAEIVRLLLLTGCRKSEIVNLRWSEVRDGMLALADSKTGPRTVPLNSQARRVLERQSRKSSPFVFPSLSDPNKARSANIGLWYRVRREAGIEDVRLHDLRHTVASHAVMNGVPVPVVSRLLGHSDVRMTLRYAHLADRDIEAAAERVGTAMAQVMGLGLQLHPLGASSGGSSG